MGYSRRFRFMDGKSSLHRVEFAREFDTRLAAARHENAAGDDGERRTVPLPSTPAADPGQADHGAAAGSPEHAERGAPEPEATTAVEDKRPKRPML